VLIISQTKYTGFLRKPTRLFASLL